MHWKLRVSVSPEGFIDLKKAKIWFQEKENNDLLRKIAVIILSGHLSSLTKNSFWLTKKYLRINNFRNVIKKLDFLLPVTSWEERILCFYLFRAARSMRTCEWNGYISRDKKINYSNHDPSRESGEKLWIFFFFSLANIRAEQHKIESFFVFGIRGDAKSKVLFFTHLIDIFRQTHFFPNQAI